MSTEPVTTRDESEEPADKPIYFGPVGLSQEQIEGLARLLGPALERVAAEMRAEAERDATRPESHK